jgi:hypothetical protein
MLYFHARSMVCIEMADAFDAESWPSHPLEDPD